MDNFCKDCSLQFDEKVLFHIHPSCIEALVNKKKDTKGLNHKCPTCEFNAPCKGVLKKHVDVNHKKEFTCDKCNFSTQTKSSLKIHQGSISGRFEYVPLSAIMYMLKP
jgi:predicted RNA-binding Zn-ribbon protein involved in translation (DUF1610 family)